MATSRQRQQPLKRVPNCQKNSQKQPVFSGLIKNSRMVMKFDPYGSLMIKSPGGGLPYETDGDARRKF